MPPSKPELSEVGKTSIQCLEDSYRWFGDLSIGLKTFDALRHHALALCGEAGEVANLVKKIDRGSLDYNAPATRVALADELADVYTYLCELAGLMGIDLQRAYERKRIVNEQRFILQRRVREAERDVVAGSN